MEYAGAPASSGYYSEAARSRCFALCCLGNFLTPIATQAYTPILPLFLKVAQGSEVTTVGYVFTIKFFMSLLSFGAMLPLLKAYSMRSVLIFDYIARLVSGALYIASVQYHHADSWGLPLLFASRVLYGMTLHSFGLPIIWAGVRLPEDQRGAQVAVLNALVALGIIIGPSIASVLCSLFTDEFMGYASPGYTTLALSAVLLGLTCAVDDGGVLPTNPPHAVPVDVAEEMQRVAKTMKLAGGVNSFLMMMTALAGFEAMFSILLYDGYGLIQREQTSVWAFFGLLSLCALRCERLEPKPCAARPAPERRARCWRAGLGSLSPMAIQRLNSATQITGVACLGPPLVLSAINLTQYDTIVPLWRMFIGLVGIGISSQTCVSRPSPSAPSPSSP